MNRIEERTRPILEPLIMAPDDQRGMIGPNAQVRLAIWFYKTILMADFGLPGPLVVPDSWYKRFYETRLPPDSAAIYFGSYLPVGGNDTALAAKQPLVLRPKGVGKPAPLDRYALPGEFDSAAISMTIVRVLFQVVIKNYEGALRLTDENDAVIRLWPPTGRITVPWPPNDVHLQGRDAFNEFSQRIDYGVTPPE